MPYDVIVCDWTGVRRVSRLPRRDPRRRIHWKHKLAEVIAVLRMIESWGEA